MSFTGSQPPEQRFLLTEQLPKTKVGKFRFLSLKVVGQCCYIGDKIGNI